MSSAVEELESFIDQIDGNNTLSSGALAGAIVDYLSVLEPDKAFITKKNLTELETKFKELWDISSDPLDFASKVFEQLHNTQTYQGDNQDFSDEIITMRAALAELEQAQKQEPAQAVPAFWASENIFKESLRDNISCILTTTKCAANTVPLYTAPPAINQEIVYQVWRSTDSCEECWSWYDCDKEDYDKTHPTARRRVVILGEC